MPPNKIMPIPLDSSNELHFIKLLSALSEYKASDLHLSVAAPPNLRISGKIVSLMNEDLITNEFIQNIVFSMLTDAQAQQLQLKRSLVFAFTFKGKTRYKVHVYYQHEHLSASFRFIPEHVLPLSRLLVPQAVKDIMQLQHGLVLVAGNYGTGKSTVLAGMLEELNLTTTQHIITFEQPIEYLFIDDKSIIEQVEIGIDLPDLTYALEFASHEDVDVIMVSAPLDAVNVRIILQLVAMGKLVLVEVGALTTSRALERLVTAFTTAEQPGIRMMIATHLQAAVALQFTTTATGTTALAAEVLRPNAEVLQIIKHESFEQLDAVLENNQTDGMATFTKSQQELQNLS